MGPAGSALVESRNSEEAVEFDYLIGDVERRGRGLRSRISDGQMEPDNLIDNPLHYICRINRSTGA